MILSTVLIGLGMVADTHVNAIAQLNGKVRLKGVFARGQDAAHDYAVKAESICADPCEVYPSPEAIAADADLDFVIIATPPNARLSPCTTTQQSKSFVVHHSTRQTAEAFYFNQKI